jgi:hypothetical protein
MAPALRMVSSIPSMLKSDCVLTLPPDTCKQDDLQIFFAFASARTCRRAFGLMRKIAHLMVEAFY